MSQQTAEYYRNFLNNDYESIDKQRRYLVTNKVLFDIEFEICEAARGYMNEIEYVYGKDEDLIDFEYLVEHFKERGFIVEERHKYLYISWNKNIEPNLIDIIRSVNNMIKETTSSRESFKVICLGNKYIEIIKKLFEKDFNTDVSKVDRLTVIKFSWK